MNDPPRKTKSGEMPEVDAFREKIDSIREHTIPQIEERTRESEEICDEIKSLQPPAAPCRVCDDERVVALGHGAQTEFFACPACIGLRRESMALEYAETAEALCAAEGVPVRWLA